MYVMPFNHIFFCDLNFRFDMWQKNWKTSNHFHNFSTLMIKHYYFAPCHCHCHNQSKSKSNLVHKNSKFNNFQSIGPNAMKRNPCTLPLKYDWGMHGLKDLNVTNIQNKQNKTNKQPHLRYRIFQSISDIVVFSFSLGISNMPSLNVYNYSSKFFWQNLSNFGLLFNLEQILKKLRIDLWHLRVTNS